MASLREMALLMQVAPQIKADGWKVDVFMSSVLTVLQVITPLHIS